MVRIRRTMWLCAIVLGAIQVARSTAQVLPHTQLLLVVDGLRPDYVTQEVMPRLSCAWRTRRRLHCTPLGVSHGDTRQCLVDVHRRVPRSARPDGKHGLLGEDLRRPRHQHVAGRPAAGDGEGRGAAADRADAGRGASARGQEVRGVQRRVERLRAPAQPSGLRRGGRSIPSSSIRRRSRRRCWPLSAWGPKKPSRTSRATSGPSNAYLSLGLGALKSDVAAIWFGDPDATAHQMGIGSPTTVQALEAVDAEIGRIEDTLQPRAACSPRPTSSWPRITVSRRIQVRCNWRTRRTVQQDRP